MLTGDIEKHVDIQGAEIYEDLRGIMMKSAVDRKLERETEGTRWTLERP